MDINSIKDVVSNLTLYDLKAGVRKVQNAVMNYTEMEAKVREATNNEPWGASSSLMQEIANGTFSYQTLNEIMPMIYRRFTEKAAEEWRQIYKALQLLEFLIKNGSERVIDDARSHLTLLKMLRQFHYIDQNGKDQGVNVRNRAKELADMLSDVDRIRAERRKARDNKAKYVGVEGSGGRYGGFSSSSMGGSGGFSSSGGRFGGFGSDTANFGGNTSGYGGYSGGVYGDGGGFAGHESTDFRESHAQNQKFEEYNEDDDADRPSRSSRTTTAARSTSDRAGVKKTAEAPKKGPEIDLFDFNEPAPSSSGTGLPSLVGSPGTTTVVTNEDDEFDDFQSAPATTQTSTALPTTSTFSPIAPPASSNTTQFAAPKPVSAPQQANLSEMVGLSSISPPPATNSAGFGGSAFAATPKPAAPTAFQAATPNYFSTVPLQAASSPAVMSPSAGFGGAGVKPMATSNSLAAAKDSGAGGDAFGALWSQASVGIKKANTPTAGPSMGSLAKAKSSAGIWGSPATAGAPVDTQSSAASKPVASGSSNGLDDLLG